MGNPKHTEVSVARQSPQRPDADEPELDDTTGAARPDEIEEIDRPAGPVDRALWDELRIDPVEIALPAGTGFTLRAYRPASSLTPTDVAERDLDDPFLARRQVVEEDEDDETVVILDEELAQEFADSDEDESKRRRADADTDTDTEATDEEAEEEVSDEEVPVFLSNKGKLLLFKTPSRWSVSSGPVLPTICPNWTAGMNCPNGWSRQISCRSTRTPTNSTSSWRTCAAGTTPGIRPC